MCVPGLSSQNCDGGADNRFSNTCLFSCTTTDGVRFEAILCRVHYTPLHPIFVRFGDVQAMREEKWLVNCEKDALKRDLERATQRCEQIQNDAKLEVVSGACVRRMNSQTRWLHPQTAAKTCYLISTRVRQGALSFAILSGDSTLVDFFMAHHGSPYGMPW